MFQYFKSLLGGIMELVLARPAERLIAMEIRNISEEMLVIPRLAWFIQNQVRSWIGDQNRMRILWMPKRLQTPEARWEAGAYGLSTHDITGVEWGPSDVHVGNVTALDPAHTERYSVAIVPAQAEAIEAAKRVADCVVVYGKESDLIAAGFNHYAVAPTSLWPVAEGEPFPRTWEDAFGKPEPIPGVVAAVRHAHATAKDDGYLIGTSNRFTAMAAKALARNASLEEFMEAFRDAKWAPTDTLLFYAGIDLELGRYANQAQEVAYN